MVEIVRDREVDQFEILQTGTTTSTDEVKFNALSLDGYYYGASDVATGPKASM